MNSKIFLLAIILFITSCKSTPEEMEVDQINTALQSAKWANDYKWLVILPGLGCKGCIQEAEAFMKAHITNKAIMFVLTKTESLKLLQQKTGVKVREHSNVYIDRDQRFVVPTDNAIYPCIAELKDNQAVNHQFQSPKNSIAFEQLSSKMGSK